MSQTSYPIDHPVSMAGMKADAGPDRVESFVAEEAIPFGRGLMAEIGNVESVRLAGKDNCSLAFDADFVTSNVITITVNGTAAAPITFATDHDTTAAAVAAAVDALTGVTCELDSTDANKRTFLIEMTDGSTVTVSETVTGGASQATGTPTYSADDVFRGISLQTHTKEQDSSGVAQYAINDVVNTATQGTFWVETSKAVTADSVAYVDMTGAIGKFTDASSGNKTTGGKFRSTVAAAGLAKLEINLP